MLYRNTLCLGQYPGSGIGFGIVKEIMVSAHIEDQLMILVFTELPSGIRLGLVTEDKVKLVTTS